MIRILPPGIWDNPRLEDITAYNEFVLAWLVADEGVREFYATQEEPPIVRTLEYGANCTGLHSTASRGSECEGLLFLADFEDPAKPTYDCVNDRESSSIPHNVTVSSGYAQFSGQPYGSTMYWFYEYAFGAGFSIYLDVAWHEPAWQEYVSPENVMHVGTQVLTAWDVDLQWAPNARGTGNGRFVLTYGNCEILLDDFNAKRTNGQRYQWLIRIDRSGISVNTTAGGGSLDCCPGPDAYRSNIGFMGGYTSLATSFVSAEIYGFAFYDRVIATADLMPTPTCVECESVRSAGSGSGIALGGDTNEELWIGKQPVGTEGLFDGQVDDVRIYKRALDPAEIKAMFSPQSRWELWDEPERVVVIPVTESYSIGGVELNGSATVVVIKSQTVSGGIKANGTATSTVRYNPTVTGGVKLNSTAYSAFRDIVEVGGGVKVNGQTTPTARYNQTPSGGVEANSTAIQTFNDIVEVSGGVELNGSASSSGSTYNLTMSGGIEANGTVTLWRVYNHPSYVYAATGVIVNKVTAVQNSLLLHLDAGDPTSFRGEATTNLCGNPTSIYTYWNNSGTATYIDNDTSISRLFPDVQVMSCNKDTAGDSHVGVGYAPITTSTTYTVSVYVWIPTSAGTLAGQVPYIRPFPENVNRGSLEYQGSAAWNSWPRDRWIRISKTFTSAATNVTNMYISTYLDTAGNKIYYTAPQVEQLGRLTHYTTGTRGSTVATGGGWVDLAGGDNNGALSGPTYTSNNGGGLVFNGFTDLVSVPYSGVFDFSLAQTICMWLEPTAGSNSTRRNPYNQAYGGSGTLTRETTETINYYFGTNGGDGTPWVSRNSGFTVAVDELAFITVTRDQNTNTVRWYKNGELVNTLDAAGYAATANGSSAIQIGYGYAGAFLGPIHIVQVYNRALTATEVRYNFLESRERFGQQREVATVSLIHTETPSGGVKLNGTTTYGNTYNLAISGGVKLNGIPTLFCIYNPKRIVNLVDNGYGEDGNLNNFNGFTAFDASDKYSGGGSFRWYGSTQYANSLEYIPVHANTRYDLSAWGKNGDIGGGNYNASNHQYLATICYDADFNPIYVTHCFKYPGSTDTTLAQDLNNGDTTMVITDATGWTNSAGHYYRHFAWYPYTDGTGHTYPDYYYTRNLSSSYYGGGTGTWSVGGISGNTITLYSQWTGPNLPAGTKIRNVNDGGTYSYCTNCSYTTVPNTWTKYSGYMEPYAGSGSDVATQFRPGSKYFRVLFMMNYTDGVSSNIRWNMVEIPYHVSPCGQVNGTAPTGATYNVSMSGGAKLNGTSYYPFSDIVEVSGGVKLDGTTVPNAKYDLTVSGGVELDGTTVPTAVYNLTVSGGVELDGTTVPNAKYNLTVSGGVELDGTTVPNAKYNLTVSGGVELDGTTVPTAVYNLTVSGGVELDGTTVPTAVYNLTVSGGVELNGTATQPGLFNNSMSGGVKANGSSGVNATYNFVAQTVKELAVNGEFVWDISGWTNHANGWDTAEWVNGSLHLVNDGTPDYPGIYQTNALNLVIGGSYRIIVNRTGSSYVKLGQTNSPASTSAGYDSYASGNVDATFIATHSPAYLMFVGLTDPIDVTIHSVSLQRTVVTTDGSSTVSTNAQSYETHGGIKAGGVASVNVIYDPRNRNLVVDPRYTTRVYGSPYTADSWGGDAATVTYYANGGCNDLPYKKMTKTAGGTGGSYHTNHYGIVIENNKTYVVSAFVKANMSVSLGAYTIDLNRESDNAYRTGPGWNITTDWQLIYWIYNSGADHAGIYQSRQLVYIDDNLPLEVYWCGFSVEELSLEGGNLNSTATTAITYSPVTTGGVKLNGATTPQITYKQTPSGGVKLGGASTQPGIYNISVSGGVRLNGTSYYPFSDIVEVSGGIQANGTATRTHFDTVEVSGGVSINKVNIVPDGLMLYYDVAHPNGFRGEPTTNVVTNRLPTAGWSVSNWDGSTATRTFETEGGIPHLKITDVVSPNDYPRLTDSAFSATITGTYSVSFEAKSDTAAAQISLKIYEAGSTKVVHTATLTTEWQRYEFNNQSTGFTLDQPYLKPVTTGATYYVRKIQVEAQSHATHFADGTRGTTVATGGGLTDLSGNGNHGTWSGPIYSNTYGGSLVFDGNDDTISFDNPLDQANLSQVWTVQAWINITTHPSQRLIAGLNNGLYVEYSANNALLYLNSGVNDYYTYGYSIGLNGTGWHLVTFRFDNADGHRQIWRDLSIIGNANGPNNTSTPYGQSATFSLGDPAMSIYGKVANLFFYNRKLTDAEITQNYNQLYDRFALGDVADVYVRYNPAVSGATKLDSTTPPADTYNIVVSGGVELDGTTTPRIIYNPVLTGGVELDGASTQPGVYNIVVSGGVKLNGTGQQTFYDIAEVSGGVELNGSSVSKAIYNLTVSGGVELNGSSVSKAIYNLTVSGGVELDGATTPQTIYNPVLTGGVELDGASAQPGVYNIAVSGGVKLNGTSYYPFSDIVEVGGSVKVNSTATPTVVYNPIITGSVELDGSTRPTATYNLTVSGGVELDGASTQPGVYNIVVSGGAKLNGTAVPATIYIPVTTNGVTCSGAADVQVVYSSTISGGVKVGGIAGTQITVPVHGGLRVNGTAGNTVVYNYVIWAMDIIPIPMLPEAKNRKPGCQPNIMSNQYKGLVAWWMNGEFGGNKVYDPVGNNTGLAAAANWIIDSQRGAHVFQLNGTSDYINCGHGQQLNMFGNDMTVSIWTNPASYPASGYDVILCKQSDYEIAIDSAGHVCYRLAHSWTSWTDSGRTVAQNTWTLITLVIQNNVPTLYLNGRSS